MLHPTIELPDGRRLSYAEYGDPNGTPLLYCHGIPGCRLEHPAEAITRQRRIRLLVPERPGYGESTAKPGLSLLGWADDAIALLDILAIPRSHLFGYSGGGPHALACLARFPQRFDKVFLSGSLAPFLPELAEALMPANRGLFELARDNPDVCKQHLAASVTRPDQLYAMLIEPLPPSDRQIVQEATTNSMYRATIARSLQQGFEGLVDDLHRITQDWGVDLAAINHPIQLWQGGQDRNAPPVMAEYLSRQLPDNQLHLYAEEGHLLHFKHWPVLLDTMFK